MTARARVAAALALAGCLAAPLSLLANAPDQSLRPVARGQIVQGQILPADAFISPADLGVPEQVVVPGTLAPAARPPARALSPSTFGVRPEAEPRDPNRFAAMRPRARPPRIEDTARRTEALLRQGAVCGDPSLQGIHVGRVAGNSGCGIEDAVRLRSVSGVALSTHALIDCTTAKTLKTWIDGALKKEVGRRGGGVSELKVAAHYACRPRNNQRGAKISEHGKGRAIDISAIKLRDGSEITVLDGWNTRKDGKLLRRLHKAACGPFGTVLGPESDRFHRNHFHFDTARYRSGAYCR
ncbi:extensin family protein [Pseudooceanicola nanhaiensis]|uniref:extensin-like domain-containing protein n=1 Tax=Pseudooceanicola nanhaiensis TaxID=375761 RepID=UPI001CD36EC2|nr:extensin family protein [Pseudooceanicola nanhaiensis]MCA0921857.1 extensin family protein [Pseudooceanicola nanhaiensis]